MGDRARASMNCYNKNTVEEVLQELEDALTDMVETGREKKWKGKNLRRSITNVGDRIRRTTRSSPYKSNKGAFLLGEGKLPFLSEREDQLAENQE